VARQELAAGDWAVLSLLAEQQSHGWAVASQLARGGEIGSIWALGRPFVYHSLARLDQAGLIVSIGVERGLRGPHRVVYAATPQGEAARAEWLARPVEHVRDIRSLFLLKVVLSQRARFDIAPLLAAQRAMIVPLLAWLEAQLDDTDPHEPAERTALMFRVETARMILRFIDSLSGTPSAVRATS
jgi:PadR family transcriptional regulator AphA